MANGRCTDVQARPAVCLDVTSVTRDAFQQLVPPVEAVCQAPMAACWPWGGLSVLVALLFTQHGHARHRPRLS